MNPLNPCAKCQCRQTGKRHYYCKALNKWVVRIAIFYAPHEFIDTNLFAAKRKANATKHKTENPHPQNALQHHGDFGPRVGHFLNRIPGVRPC